jgi:large subunit ribosomal protein L24
MAELKMRIKKNDIVRVITGKEVGKEGKVLKVFHSEGTLIVEKINFIYRHTKPSRQSRQGGIVEKEGPIHHSNVMVVCPGCKRPTRIRTKLLAEEAGRKTRNCTHCGEVLDK